MSRIDEEFDEAMAGRAQEAFDHGLDLEAERADCDPHDICDIHGVRVHPLRNCDACAADWQAPWIDHKHFPTRLGDTDAA